MFSVVDFPQPGRADQDDELAVRDRQVEVVDGQRAVGVALDDMVQNDLSHFGSFRGRCDQPLTAPEVRPATIRRWKSSTKITIGMVMTTAAAAIGPVGFSNVVAPVK